MTSFLTSICFSKTAHFCLIRFTDVISYVLRRGGRREKLHNLERAPANHFFLRSALIAKISSQSTYSLVLVSSQNPSLFFRGGEQHNNNYYYYYLLLSAQTNETFTNKGTCQIIIITTTGAKRQCA